MTSGTAYLLGMKKSSGGGTQSESSFLVQAINHCLTHPLTRLSGTLRIKTMMGCLIRGPQIPISISSKMVGIPCRCIATSETVQPRSEEHTSELQSLMRISYAVFCLKKKNTHINYLHL